MELATPFVVVAAAHPSLDDAMQRFGDALRAETRYFGRRAAAPQADRGADPAAAVPRGGDHARRHARRRRHRRRPHRRPGGRGVRAPHRRGRAVAPPGRRDGPRRSDRPPGARCRRDPHRAAGERPRRRRARGGGRCSGSRPSTAAGAASTSCGPCAHDTIGLTPPGRETSPGPSEGSGDAASSDQLVVVSTSGIADIFVRGSSRPILQSSGSSSSSSLHPAKAVTANAATAIGQGPLAHCRFLSTLPAADTYRTRLLQKRHKWPVPGITTGRRHRAPSDSASSSRTTRRPAGRRGARSSRRRSARRTPPAR